MARKNAPPIKTPPTTPPAEGARLLRLQQNKAQELLGSRPLTETAYTRWRNTTREFLARCFGSHSDNEFAILHSQGVQLVPGRESENNLEDKRVPRLKHARDLQ